MITDYIEHGTATLIRQLLALDFENNLVAAYIHLVMDGEPHSTLDDVIDEINQQLGLNYKAQRLMDWRNGARSCPKRASNYMRCYLLRFLFADKAAEALMTLLALER